MNNTPYITLPKLVEPYIWISHWQRCTVYSLSAIAHMVLCTSTDFFCPSYIMYGMYGTQIKRQFASAHAILEFCPPNLNT